eukprot:SAG22_NODE_16692_length_320_cov_0.696833_1_plen_48_part_10
MYKVGSYILNLVELTILYGTANAGSRRLLINTRSLRQQLCRRRNVDER